MIHPVYGYHIPVLGQYLCSACMANQPDYITRAVTAHIVGRHAVLGADGTHSVFACPVDMVTCHDCGKTLAQAYRDRFGEDAQVEDEYDLRRVHENRASRLSAIAAIRDFLGGIGPELPAYADGGYPLVYVTPEGDTLCASCATEALSAPDADFFASFSPSFVFDFLEGSDMYCEGCNRVLEAAYGDPYADEEEGEVS